MKFITDMISTISEWFRPHLFKVAFALSATILVVYGNSINRMIKKTVKPYPFYIRLLIFIGICSFGYGAFTVGFTWGISKILNQLNDNLLFPVICLLFILIGFLAERKNQL